MKKSQVPKERINVSNLANKMKTNFIPPQLTNVVSESDFWSDVSAAALLTKCRKFSHQTMFNRFTKGNVKESHYKMMKCVETFVKRYKFDQWITCRTPKQEVYYLNVRNGRTQWERPKKMEKMIEFGKRRKNYKEKWKECEFLHILLVQCEARSHRSKSGYKCSQEMRKLKSCFTKRFVFVLFEN